MRQIKHNSASNVLRLEYPTGWDPSAITGVTLTVLDSSATELLAADDATLYTATTLDGAVARYLSSIKLDAGAGNLAAGDPILISGAEGAELARVKAFVSGTKTAELEATLDNAYADDDDVYAAFCSYTLDTTTVADYPAGIVVTLLWTPAGSGQPITEQAQVSKSALDVPAFALRFSRLYPRAYNALTVPVDRLADIVAEAEDEIELEMLSRNLDIQRIVDQPFFAPVLMAKVAHLWTINGDEDGDNGSIRDERETLGVEYRAKMEQICKLPIWTDYDHDLAQDEGEETSHEEFFERHW